MGREKRGHCARGHRRFRRRADPSRPAQPTVMKALTGGIAFVDLLFQGSPRTIAAAVLQGPDGVAIVDPGPSTTLPVLRRDLESAGIAKRDVRALLLTH